MPYAVFYHITAAAKRQFFCRPGGEENGKGPHSIIDAASVFAPEEGSAALNVILPVLVVVMAVACCLYLAKRAETPAINRVGGKK